MNKENIKFYYIGRKQGFPNVITVATRIENEGKDVQIAFAFTSKKDKFNKAMGRRIATGRFNILFKAFVVPFTGHSADDLVKLWNSGNYDLENLKPLFWKGRKIFNDPKHGLLFTEKDSIFFAPCVQEKEN